MQFSLNSEGSDQFGEAALSDQSPAGGFGEFLKILWGEIHQIVAFHVPLQMFDGLSSGAQAFDEDPALLLQQISASPCSVLMISVYLRLIVKS